jgi:bifunctional DNase/RNase
MSQTNEIKPVRIRALAPSEGGLGCVVLLEEIGGTRMVPIVTGSSEGQAMALKVAGVSVPRPLTHDLLTSVIETTGWKVARVVVTELKDETFYARLDLEKDGETRAVDARPSDAVNVALRTGAPILVSEQVFANVEPLHAPISQGEVEKFKSQLESADLSSVFEELEKKPAPREGLPPFAPPPEESQDDASD